jgi:hypothetical protein
MGDVIKAVRVILEELEPLNPVERGRVLGTMLALQGDCLTVQPGTPAPESTQEPTRAPKPYPKAGGATRSDPSPGRPVVVDRTEDVLRLLRRGPASIGQLAQALRIDRHAWELRKPLLTLRDRGVIEVSEPRSPKSVWRLVTGKGVACDAKG